MLWRVRVLALPATFIDALLSAQKGIAGSPSFECSKARRPAEFVVCNSDLLSRLDVVVVRGYAYLKAVR